MTASESQLSRDLSTDALRGAFAQHPSGLAALCTIVDGQPEGIVASSFTVGVSLDPPLVMFAVQKTSRTWPKVKRGGRIGVSILAEAHQSVCRQIASRDGDRFAGLRLDSTDAGALFLQDAALWLETSVENEVEAGDHYVVLLRVHAHATHGGANDPLVFHNSTFATLSAPELV
ncbi:flavin reductase family protein [Zhihengliuella salsuginis]|uniref:Oxidoreductase n=1 Tax=Zhihengliuella salsuginis TaxID=578222 RepID=A0ABQ3GL24_9MICC|nr:flavin reductase family protein [Zhihengliuella salsuginis]GHD12309.1 putative oxidoreductase [Zhihengliuella salsuginis]